MMLEYYLAYYIYQIVLGTPINYVFIDSIIIKNSILVNQKEN